MGCVKCDVNGNDVIILAKFITCEGHTPEAFAH
jgi:hypothetical protein